VSYFTVRVNVVVCAVSDPDVPVTVMVYVPAGVPPVVPPPFEDELPPPQAVRNKRPETSRNMSSKLSTFFRREPPLAPSNVIPPKGSNIA
jgi:hypothetical protein